MIPFGWLIVVIALLIFPIALRGRRVATGQFCRACRFNLHGLTISEEQSKCPECGAVVVEESARRTSLRKSSFSGIVTSIVLILIASGLLIIGYSGAAPRVYAQFPDFLIVHLAMLGDDDATNELVPRLLSQPPISDSLWDHLIQNSLNAQADQDQDWEPIYGEILAIARSSQRLTETQSEHYFTNALSTEFVMRESIPMGYSEITTKFLTKPGRIHAINNDETGKIVKINVLSTKVGDAPVQAYGSNNEGMSLGTYQFSVPAQNSIWSFASSLKIEPEWSQVGSKVGDTIQVRVDYQVVIENSPYGSNPMPLGPAILSEFSITRDVVVKDPESPLVELIQDAQRSTQVCENFNISPLRVIRELDPDRQQWMPILGMTLRLKDKLEIPTAFRVYVVVDGKEYEINPHAQESSKGGFYGTILSWRPDPENPEMLEQTKELIQKLSISSEAAVVFRTDPTIANSNPAIGQVIETLVMFPSVPIQLVDQYQEIWNSTNRMEWVSPDCD